MRPLPKSVDYVGWTLRVERHTEGYIQKLLGEPPDGDRYYGCLDLQNSRIVICTDIPDFLAWETLLHEMVHAAEKVVSSDMGLGACDLTEEKVLSLFTRIYTGMLVASGIVT